RAGSRAIETLSQCPAVPTFIKKRWRWRQHMPHRRTWLDRSRQSRLRNKRPL
ncbi:hypothetical protein LTR59_016773, partial [Friedmanniomyces endolithicus]